MSEIYLPKAAAQVVSIHLHPACSGPPLQAVHTVEAVAGKGLRGDFRFFARNQPGQAIPSRRQVTLIERETIAAYAAALGLSSGLRAGAVRANIETLGILLVSLVGRRVRVGEAILLIYEARKPCAKMDQVHPGLRRLMEDGCQGVLAEVEVGGEISVGDPISAVSGESTSPATTQRSGAEEPQLQKEHESRASDGRG